MSTLQEIECMNFYIAKEINLPSTSLLPIERYTQNLKTYIFIEFEKSTKHFLQLSLFCSPKFYI